MKTPKFLISILALLLLCNCSNSDIEEQIAPQCSKRVNSDIEITRSSLEVPDSTAYPYTIEEDKILLAELGFDTTYVQVFENCYKIDDSNGVEKEALRIYREKPNTRISIDRHLPIESQHIYLNTYWGGVNSADIILEAIDEWNNIENCNIHFYSSARGSDENSAECNIDFKVTQEYYGEAANSLVYTAHWNFVGVPNTVTVNTLHPHWALISDTQKKYLIMHALGHVIALNDITDEWDYLWDPTIMKSHTFISESNTEVWSGFSENDIAQLQQLYPIPTTEFSFEWSGSDSTSELLCQTNSTISVEVTQSGGNQTDYTVEYTVDADESDYIVSEWGNTLEFSFLKAGTYTVTVTPVAEEETFAGKTVEIVVYDVPEMSYSWSPALPNTENKFQINKPYNLTIEGVDSEFDVTVTIAAETSGNEYTCTKVNNREYQITFEDLGAYDITLKVKRGTRTLITETIAVTAVGEATFNYSWNPMVDSSGYLSRETDYTLQVDYVNEYYGNVVLYYAAYYQRENVTSSVLQSSNGNSAVFNFNMPGEYNIIVSAFKNGTKIDSKNIECVVSGSWFDLPEDPVLELNKEYTISLIHIDPNYEDVEIVFDVTEKLFDRTSENITKTQINDNTIKITLKDYGCYYVTASVYSSGTLIETKYANITHLYRISDPQFTLYDCTLISSEGYYGTWSLGYQVKFGSAATMQGRFGCYVEQETERRRGYPIIERRMDRQWTQKLIPIKINKSKSTTFNLSRGGLVYEDNYTTAVCTYYTGSVFYPKEGFRNTESLDLLDLPMIEVETEVNNITGIPSEF